MDIYKIEKLPMRPLIYGIVGLYLILDFFVFKGPLYDRTEFLRPGGKTNVAEAEERNWACTVNGQPITKAQLNLAVDLDLAREGKRRSETSDQALATMQFLVMRKMIFDKLIEQKEINYAVETPQDFIDVRIAQFESQFVGEELEEVCKTHQLTQKQLQQLLAAHARQQYWLEDYAKTYVIQVSETGAETTAREWFDKFGHKMVMPETIRARQIFLSTVLPFWTDELPPIVRLSLQLARVKQVETPIRALRARLQAGATIADLADESEDERSKMRGGDLGYFSRDRMPAEFVEPVFELETNELSEPFLTKMGWHIVEVTERLSERQMTWEEARSEVLAHHKSEWRTWAVDAFIEDRLWIDRQAVVIQFPTSEYIDRY
ncbi:MAG: hypothetical protein ACI8UO_000245 [Verrucomicrobiales bacterium]|jgi:hypothetical protein